MRGSGRGCRGRDPQEPQDPQEESLEPHQTILQGFRTVAQTLSAAYGSTSSDIQHVIRWSLRESTTEDWTFIFGASNAIRHWVESVRLAMACTEMGKGAKDHIQLLTNAREAGKEAIDAILGLIPEEAPRLPRVFPRVDVESVLSIAHHYTDEALRNIHTQLSYLVREHFAGPEQSGVFFNTILPVTCLFWHQMDEMAMNQVFPGSQIIPTLWGTRRGVLEGLSLMGPPSCSASWPASLVEQVTPIPGSSGEPGSTKTPTKSNIPRAGELTPGSGKKVQQNIKQVTGLWWNDPQQGKEDIEARKLEERHWRNPPSPSSLWMTTRI